MTAKYVLLKPKSEEEYERIVRPILTVGSEVFGVTDRAYYIIRSPEGDYEVYPTLKILLESSKSTIGRKLLEHLRRLDLKSKIVVLPALVSETIPEALFAGEEKFESVSDFINYLLAYGSERVIFEEPREQIKGSPLFSWYREYIECGKILGLDLKLCHSDRGVALCHDGVAFIIVGGVGK